MDKVNKIQESPWDFFILPVWIHKKLSVSLKGLIPAFLFVGVFDMFFAQNIFKASFFRGGMLELTFKLLAFLMLSLLIGAIDVVITMVPIAEFGAMIGKRSEKYVNHRIPVILMKSYALSHFLFIIPSALYVYSGVDWVNVNMTSASQIRLLFSILLVLLNFLPFAQLGIIYRTISVRTRLQVFEKLILILAAYFWMQISGGAIIFLEGVFHGVMESLG